MKINYKQNTQELWDNIKRTNSRIAGFEVGEKIQTNGMENVVR